MQCLDGLALLRKIEPPMLPDPALITPCRLVILSGSLTGRYIPGYVCLKAKTQDSSQVRDREFDWSSGGGSTAMAEAVWPF